MPRFNHSALVIAALTTTIAALSFPVWSYADRSGTGVSNTAAGTVNTQWGPLTASDRDLIVRVRLAGLWELPAGEKAMDKSSSASVKEAADHLLVGHGDLDERVRNVAAQLNVELPNQPNEAQQGFLAQMDAAQGKEFDRVWSSLLRKAHGTIFPPSRRSGTRPRTRWCVSWRRTPTRPCSTTSRCWRRPERSTSTPSPTARSDSCTRDSGPGPLGVLTTPHARPSPATYKSPTTIGFPREVPLPRMNGTFLVGLAIAGTVGALAYPVFYSYPHRNDAATAAAITGDTVNTQWGPLTALDRELIVRVRLAGLWELPRDSRR